jgi:hypothetical protein
VIRFSFRNLAEAASIAASTTFTEQDTLVGLRFPTRPYLRGYSPDLSNHRITFDFATATTLDVLAAIHANFSAATFQGNASDTWGAPSYNPSASVIGVSGNDRYHHAHRPVGFSFRYASLSVPTGATTDGSTRWALGGIWAGVLTSPPWDILMDPEEEKLEARRDIETADGRLLQRIKLDDNATRITCHRVAQTEADLAAWRAIDRQWSAAPGQAALVLLRDSYAEEAYVMRQVSVSAWTHRRIWMESDMTLHEVTAG